ncbi:MAG TPA: DUF2007 domain-containing protein [Egibacteraceae bacterium]|nr:DUF2007 domain-containing protein [Egibacteraceae bacterium]
MRRVHTARTLADAYLVKHVLEAKGITTTVRGEHLVGAAGEVPVSPDTWPSVWVADEEEARAREILQQFEAPPAR